MIPSSSRLAPVEANSLADWAWYAWVVLGVAITLTVAGMIVLQRGIAQTEAERFTSVVHGIEERILRRMETHGALLRGAAGFFDSAPTVDRKMFATYMGHIQVRANYPGIVGLGWTVPIPVGSEVAIEKWLHDQGYADAKLWPEAAADHERTSVILLEPADEANTRLIGFDLAADAGRHAALRQAMSEQDAVATAPASTAQEHDPSAPTDFLVFLPIPVQNNPKMFRGFVYASFNSHDLFDGLFGKTPDAPVSVTITDHASGALLYSSVANENPRHEVRRTIAMLHREWDVDYRSTPIFEQNSDHSLVLLFGGAGLVLGVGLFLLARSQVRAVGANAALYQRATSARREAELNLDINRRLASTLDPQAVAQAVIDAGRELTGATFGAFCTTSPVGAPQLYAQAGKPEPTNIIPTLHKLARDLRQEGHGDEVIRIPDLRDSLTIRPGAEIRWRETENLQVASYLEVPVRSRTGDILGSLMYIHPDPDRFSSDHERQLLGLAAQAAIAFDKARLFEAERQAKRIAAHRADDLGRANSELQQFVYVSSHDLQEPLRTITQFLDLLRRRHGQHLTAEAQRYIRYTSESASRMYELLNDLLTYSRLGHDAERTVVDLGEIIAEVLLDLGLSITETKAVITTGAMPTVHGDRSKLRSLFQNLIGNALKFRHPEQPQITISAIPERTANGWRILVADNGIGIQPEHREAIFEVFHRLHDRNAFPGTGIGLAICRKVVEQHGGRIWVEDTPGGGATFYFTLIDSGSGLTPAANLPISS